MSGGTVRPVERKGNDYATISAEAWLNHIISVEQHFPGYGGVNIIRPYEGSERYAMLLRFDTLEYLQA
jgi:antibiotic biosynthesis monooxygenase (ABM) superfamily enzyme